MSEARSELSFYLNRARQLAQQDRYQEARTEIEAAYKYAGADEVALVDEAWRQIEEQRTRRVQELTAKLTALLGEPADRLDAQSTEQGEVALAALCQIHPKSDEVKTWEEQWRSHRRHAEAQRDLRETQRQLEELWKAPYLLLSRYDEALALAKRKAGEHPDEPAFRELLQEAERRRAEAYRQEGELSTNAMTAAFKGLIKEVERLHEDGESELPWYEWGVGEIEGKRVRKPVIQRFVPIPPGVMSPEPISHLYRMAQEYEDGKAEEYRQHAQSALPANPELAAEWVIPLLSAEAEVPGWVRRRKSEAEWNKERERFLYVSENKRKELDAFYKKEIAPRLQARERARAILSEALKPGQEPEIGWALIAQAAIEDPYLEQELEQARVILRPRLRVHWQRDLQRAEDARRAGRFEEAQAVAERIRDRIGTDPDAALQGLRAEAERLRGECASDRDLLTYVEGEAQRIAGLVAQRPDEAEQALADLEAKVAGRPLRFQQPLQAPRVALQARLSLEQKMAGWERRLRQTDPGRLSDAVFQDQAALQAVLDGLEQILEEIDQEGPEARLASLKKRVLARQRCLQGRADWFAGLYNRATEHWRAAQEGDDATLVARWLQEAEDAVDVSQALETASAQQKAGQYREALKTLEPWLPPRPSPWQHEVIDLKEKIRKEYGQALTAEIEKLVRDKRPLYQQLVDKIQELAHVDPAQAAAYKAERFPAIYEEWGDQRARLGLGQYPDAVRDYDEALKYARGEAHARIAGKRRRLQKAIVFYRIETPIRERKWLEVQEALVQLLGEYPDEVEILHRLAEIALEQVVSEMDAVPTPAQITAAKEGVGRSQFYLGNAQRRLDEAIRGGNPGLAGLETADAITAWRFRLDVLGVKARALEAIVRFIGDAREQLQPSHPIAEYRLARMSRKNLEGQLQGWRGELGQMKETVPGAFTHDPTLEREWKAAMAWLEEQAGVKGVHRTYARLEGELIRSLETELARSTGPDVETLVFAAAPPPDAVKRRWQTGLKILYLSDGRRGTDVYREVVRAVSRLASTVQAFQGDRHGPESDLEGNPLAPIQALESQILWAENVQSWAALLRDLLDEYNWAAGKEEESRNDARTAHDTMESFKAKLVELRNRVRDAERRLEAAVGAGKARRRSWGQVDWRQIVKKILLSRLAAANEDWSDLEDIDLEKRWACWQQAVKVLSGLRLASDRPEQAPWSDINPVIQDAGLDENWESILSPLADIRQQFGEHRVVTELTERRDEAKRQRDRLVLLAAELYASVQAEEFQAALSLMDQLQNLDPEDRYGFRARMTIPDFMEGRSMSWDGLRQNLEAQQRQWEELQAWWAEVEHSALRPWRKQERNEVIELARRADFDRAIQLCRDARDGALPGGRTNRLGGGLALKPLQDHLRNMPEEVSKPISWRVKRMEPAIEQWQHDTAEAVRELDFWLAPL